MCCTHWQPGWLRYHLPASENAPALDSPHTLRCGTSALQCCSTDCECFLLPAQVEVQRRKQRQRQHQLQAALQSGPWLLRVLRQGWLHSSYALADHTRNALILSVFAFKVRTCSGWRCCIVIAVIVYHV